MKSFCREEQPRAVYHGRKDLGGHSNVVQEQGVGFCLRVCRGVLLSVSMSWHFPQIQGKDALGALSVLASNEDSRRFMSQCASGVRMQVSHVGMCMILAFPFSPVKCFCFRIYCVKGFPLDFSTKKNHFLQ